MRRLLIVAVCLALVGCAISNPHVGDVSYTGRISGFWIGIWHGLISPVALIAPLFNRDVNIYDEIHPLRPRFN